MSNFKSSLTIYLLFNLHTDVTQLFGGRILAVESQIWVEDKTRYLSEHLEKLLVRTRVMGAGLE